MKVFLLITLLWLFVMILLFSIYGNYPQPFWFRLFMMIGMIVYLLFALFVGYSGGGVYGQALDNVNKKTHPKSKK